MMQRSPFELRGCLSAALSVALLIGQPIGAAAQIPSAEKPAADTQGKLVMTRDELRACMNEQDRLQQLVGKIKSEQAELDRQRTEIERVDKELGSSVGTVDPNYRASLEALKKERAKRDALADAYNARLATVREQSAAYESGRTSWTGRCANRGYDPKDEAAIRLEQKQAAEAGSKKE